MKMSGRDQIFLGFVLEGVDIDEGDGNERDPGRFWPVMLIADLRYDSRVSFRIATVFNSTLGTNELTWTYSGSLEPSALRSEQ